MLGIVESTRDITQHRYLLDQLEEKGIKSIDDVIVLSKKLLRCISNFPFEIEHNIINISCSIGISLYDYKDNQEADKLISDADNAMYTAKKLGKNRVSANL